MKGLYEPEQGMIMHPNTVTIMLLWLVLCMTGVIGRSPTPRTSWDWSWASPSACSGSSAAARLARSGPTS